jgi:hypothetical protein
VSDPAKTTLIPPTDKSLAYSNAAVLAEGAQTVIAADPVSGTRILRWDPEIWVGLGMGPGHYQPVLPWSRKGGEDVTLVEAITLVGSIVGLATGIFTVWDRWARGRPLAWVTAEKRFSGNPEEYICVKNPGHSDVFILGVRVHPKTPQIYGVAKDHSVRAISSSFHGNVNVLLPPGKEQYLPIIELPKDLDAPIDTAGRRVCFLIYWRKTSSTWLPQFPVIVMTSTDDIKQIAAAATRPEG